MQQIAKKKPNQKKELKMFVITNNEKRGKMFVVTTSTGFVVTNYEQLGLN